MTLKLAQENLGVLHNFFLAQDTIFPGVHPAWTKHGFHTGANFFPIFSYCFNVVAFKTEIYEYDI